MVSLCGFQCRLSGAGILFCPTTDEPGAQPSLRFLTESNPRRCSAHEVRSDDRIVDRLIQQLQRLLPGGILHRAEDRCSHAAGHAAFKATQNNAERSVPDRGAESGPQRGSGDARHHRVHKHAEPFGVAGQSCVRRGTDGFPKITTAIDHPSVVLDLLPGVHFGRRVNPCVPKHLSVVREEVGGFPHRNTLVAAEIGVGVRYSSKELCRDVFAQSLLQLSLRHRHTGGVVLRAQLSELQPFGFDVVEEAGRIADCARRLNAVREIEKAIGRSAWGDGLIAVRIPRHDILE